MTIQRGRTVGACLFLLALVLAPARLTATPSPSKQVSVYTSSGTIVTLMVQPGQQQRYVLVAENVPIDPTQRGRPDHVYAGWEARLRFLRLDLQTGKVLCVKEFDPPAPGLLLFEEFVDYAGNGRIAYCDDRQAPYPSRIIEPDGTSRDLPKQASELLLNPTWHPDSQHLLALKATRSKTGLADAGAVLLGIPPSGPVTEQRVADVGGYPIRWSSDGRFIYYAQTPDEHTVCLRRVAYPSRAMEKVATFEVDTIWTSKPFFVMAEQSAEVVWLACRPGSEGRPPLEVWRVSSAHGPERTALSLSEKPRHVALSPDGKSLAVVARDGKVYVTHLDSGAKELVPAALVAEREVPIVWVLGGKALLTSTDNGTRLVLIPVGALGTPQR